MINQELYKDKEKAKKYFSKNYPELMHLLDAALTPEQAT